MVNIQKEERGTALYIRVSGSIEESVVLESVVGPFSQKELIINCRDVPRINSVGVKVWIKYFQGLFKAGITLRFQECSTSIVEQINLISNFVPPSTVESVFVPFSCNQCKTELTALFMIDDLKKSSLELPELKCTQCGGPAAFDDIPEEYFGFLDRRT